MWSTKSLIARLFICQESVPEKWENPLVEGIAPCVDSCLFEWITFAVGQGLEPDLTLILERDRKSTRLNSSHGYISYAVFCLKKKKRTKYGDHSVSLTYTSYPQ